MISNKKSKALLLLLAILPVLLSIWINHKFGGGTAFESDYVVGDVPLVMKDNIETIRLDMPPGCITISPLNGRVFFDTHPWSYNPKSFSSSPDDKPAAVVFELLQDGSVIPWPSNKEEVQQEKSLFVAPFGLTADQQGRIWFTEPAILDRWQTRILALDVETGTVLVDHKLPFHVGRGAQDLRVTPDGKYVLLADSGILGILPGSILVLEVETLQIVRTISHRPSMGAQNWFLQNSAFDKTTTTPKRLFWGLITFQVGLDGISLSPDGEWLYLGPMVHNTMFRMPMATLLDWNASDTQVKNSIQPISAKPPSDGIATTKAGSLLITDIQNGGLAILTTLDDDDNGKLQTLTKDSNVAWADSIEVYEDTVVFTDSFLGEYMQQNLQPPPRELVQSLGPFYIYRFQLPEGL